MSSSEFWVSLSAVSGVGPRTLWQVNKYLKKQDVGVDEWWQSRKHWLSSGLKPQQIEGLAAFQKKHTPGEYVEYLNGLGVRTIGRWQTSYPAWLRQTPDHPWVLYVWGAGATTKLWPEFWSRPAVAVVGTRQVTPYGVNATNRLVEQMVGLGGTTTVSGFMVGVDVAAHQAAVRSGGHTVCVLGYGHGRVYPRAVAGVYQQWLQHPKVVFVSEHPPGTEPKKGFFSLRNRIVAGVSQAVVVVEAAVGSGSLITAELAVEYGRLVCGVPGSIFSPLTMGVMSLAQQGALWVSSGAEVLNQIGLQVPLASQVRVTLDDLVLQLLATQATTTDELLHHTNWTPEQLLPHLSQLELLGKIRRHGERWYIAQ